MTIPTVTDPVLTAPARAMARTAAEVADADTADAEPATPATTTLADVVAAVLAPPAAMDPVPAAVPARPVMTVQPLTGSGLVMRQGDLILACPEADIGAVVSVFADVVAAGGDGRMLARRVAAVLREDMAGDILACAVCGPTYDGRLAVLVYGAARAEVDTVDGPVTLAGDVDIMPVGRVLPGPIGGLRLELPGAAEPNPRTRLDVGVVVAAGVKAVFAGGTVPAAAPAVPAQRMSAVPAQRARAGAMRHGTDGSDADAMTNGVTTNGVTTNGSVRNGTNGSAGGPTHRVGPVASRGGRAPARGGPPQSRREPAPDRRHVPASDDHWHEPVDDHWHGPVDDDWHGPAVHAERIASRQPAQRRPMPAFVGGSTGEHPLVEPTDMPVRRAESPAPAHAEAHAEAALPALRLPAPTVHGLRCPEGHFNDPRLNYCAVCGTSMVQSNLTEEEDSRPPLGVLVLDRDGTLVLDGDVVIGREPELDRDVVVGIARPLTLDEPAQSVSRQHARITLIDWDVFVVDLGSKNGTRLQRPGEPPTRIVPHALTPITPGTIVWLGERWLRYESNRNYS